MLLDGKSTVITGAGSGVGRASALRFAEEGAKVVVADIDLDGAKETVRSIEAAGGTAIAVGVDVSKEAEVAGDDRRRGRPFGRLDIIFNNVGIPTPRLGHDLRGPHPRGLRPPGRGEPRRRVPRLQARGAAVQGAGRRRRHPQHRLGGRAGGVGRHRLRRHQGRGAPAHQGRRHRGRPVRDPGATRSARPACRYTGFMAAGGHDRRARRTRCAIAEARRRDPPARRGRSPPRTAPRPRCTWCRTRRRTSPACCCPSTAGTWPDDSRERRRAARPRASCGSCSTCAAASTAHSGGGYNDDPYPDVARAARAGPVHAGIVHELTGYPGDWFFHGLPYPDRPHFSAFSYAACDAAYRNAEVFASHAAEESIDTSEPGVINSMLSMGGAQHRRYRALVQPSFVPAKAQWWITNWIERDRPRADRRVRRRRARRAQRRLLRRHPGAHHHRELRRRRRAGARHPRVLMRDPPRVVEILEPIVAARREEPAGRPHQRAGRGRAHRRGRRHPPAHRRRDLLVRACCCWRRARAPRGSRWASRSPRCSQRPDVLDAVRADRAAAAAGHRGVGAVDADRPDVLALGHRATPSSAASQMPAGLGAAPLPRRRQPRSRALGPARRVRHQPAARSRRSRSATGPTCASACTSPAPR